MKNGIYLVATPIGNIADITLRALDVLKNVDIIACEDTRVTKKLMTLLNLSIKDKKFVMLHDHNEADCAKIVVDLAKEGKSVAYVSDAGSPLISDPGFKLARKAKENGVYLTTIPGACAAICALQISGLPSNAFMFCGFIPNKEKARRDFLLKNKNVEATLIFYERADRVLKTLSVMAEVWPEREVAVAREITKVYEECQNGKAKDLIDYYTSNDIKGEVVIMVSGDTTDDEKIDYTRELKAELSVGNLKMAVKKMVEKYHLNRNDVYQKALELKNNG